MSLDKRVITFVEIHEMSQRLLRKVMELENDKRKAVMIHSMQQIMTYIPDEYKTTKYKLRKKGLL